MHRVVESFKTICYQGEGQLVLAGNAAVGDPADDAAADATADNSAPAQPPPAPSASVFDCSTHLMHGVLHYNGFGHLARINGARLASQRIQSLRSWQRNPELQHAARRNASLMLHSSMLLYRYLTRRVYCIV
jgi:hypothetical protein